ncbi:hypothetical protein TRAPUB_6996 [Trametes pubescens]|uniref:Uncharacterized protein n=1 Tax=Trametes pubescens TaxID=154538 RepID=A0A1M2V481_TRAPU|nr:hypothetical protein TRAPUB_6996 [Trametes pubescens]
MPRVRNDNAADSSNQWNGQSSGSSRVEWTARYSEGFPDAPRGLPDVPRNIGHHHYDMDPVYPRYIGEGVGPKDNLNELTGARPPLAPPGSAQNPVVIEDDENARRYRAALALGPPPGLENSPRRSTHQTANNSQPQSSTDHNRSQPSANNASAASGSSSSRTNDHHARAGPSSAAEPPVGQTRYKKTASDGYTPKMSSPLKQVAFKASTHTLAVPATQGRWQIPPQNYSTTTVSVNSVPSSDSEYDEW